jgi:spoIIIJ-associated protein
MEWIEVQAKSLDEAVELALDRLGVIADELEYEVLDEPRSGFLGRLGGRGSARIRARVKPLSREKPTDRRRRRRGGERSGNGGGPREKPAAVGSGARGGSGSGGSGEKAPGRSSGRSRSRRSRSGGGREAAAVGTKVAHDDAEANTVDGGAVLTIDEQAAAAARFTEQLVREFGLTAEVGAEVVDDDIELRIDGEGSSLGVLVGPKGATLQALEELVRAVVQHAAGGQSARLHLDVASYRERRREALAAFVTQIAAEVREAGTERALEPMNPADRKVVHDTVADLDGVATSSVGEEPRRRVVISPA